MVFRIHMKRPCGATAWMLAARANAARVGRFDPGTGVLYLSAIESGRCGR